MVYAELPHRERAARIRELLGATPTATGARVVVGARLAGTSAVSALVTEGFFALLGGLFN